MTSSRQSPKISPYHEGFDLVPLINVGVTYLSTIAKNRSFASADSHFGTAVAIKIAYAYIVSGIDHFIGIVIDILGIHEWYGDIRSLAVHLFTRHGVAGNGRIVTSIRQPIMHIARYIGQCVMLKTSCLNWF